MVPYSPQDSSCYLSLSSRSLIFLEPELLPSIVNQLLLSLSGPPSLLDPCGLISNEDGEQINFMQTLMHMYIRLITFVLIYHIWKVITIEVNDYCVCVMDGNHLFISGCYMLDSLCTSSPPPCPLT